MLSLRCLVISGLLASLPVHANNILTGLVVGVSDGDTITVLDGQRQQHKVRVMGIDAPEKAQAFGDKSKANLSWLVFDKDVQVEWSKRDRYQRIVGKVKVQPPDCSSCAQSLDAGLAQVATGMAASPFDGEGHRKVWARLRILKAIRVSRARILRLMRENQLLSPHRRPQGSPSLHDGRITTDRPNQMWGTDGIRIETVDQGWVWVFSAVDHFDACCVGIHAVKIGNRFAALQPIAQGLLAEFGATGADAGRGLALRMDHGTQYTADDFLNQVRFWGVAPSFAFVAEPQTNGVAERFNRTLKEQAIHGRLFQNVEEVRAAVTEFKDRYNHHWRLEKLGFMTPLEARQAYAMRKAA